MIKPEIDLELSIKSLETYSVDPAIIETMLVNLQNILRQNRLNQVISDYDQEIINIPNRFSTEGILKEVATENKMSISQMIRKKELVIIAMERYAKLYHANELKKLNVLSKFLEITCDRCSCHPTVIYATSKGRFCKDCKPAN